MGRYGRWAAAIALGLGLALLLHLSPGLVAAPSDPAALGQQGTQAYQAGQVDTAIQLWDAARQQYQERGDRAGEARMLAQLGTAYLQQARYGEAVQVLEALRPLAPALNDPLAAARALSNLGIAYKVVGNFGAAIATQKEAGRLFLAAGDRQGLGQALTNLGNAFERIGDYEKAQIAYTQSLRLARQLGDFVGESIALSNLGGLQIHLGNYDEAMAQFQASLAISEGVGDRAAQASTLLNLGAAHHAQQQLPPAVQAYQQSLELATQAGDRRRQAEALSSLGLAYEESQQYPQSLTFYERGLTLARASQDLPLQAQLHNNRGHTLFRMGQLAQAETELRTAIQLLDQLRASGLRDRDVGSIFDTQLHSYSLLQQILVAANQPTAALEAAEAGRARAFSRLLASRLDAQRPTSEPPPPTLTDIRQIARTQNATLVEYALVPDDAFRFRGKQRPRAAALYIWVVAPDGAIAFRQVDLRPLWADNLTLRDLVQTARCFQAQAQCVALAQNSRGLGVQAKDGAPSPNAVTTAGLRQLYSLLIDPIADVLPRNPEDRVIFIPQDALFLVPFAALQAPDGKFLVDTHTPLTAPSIQVLALTTEPQHHRAATQAPLVVGNPVMPAVALQPGEPPQKLAPLPGAEREAIAIGRLLQVTPLIGAAATKPRILATLPQAQLIHLATHGLLEYGSEASLQGLGIPGAIALAPSPQDDGLLTAKELLDLRLTADLVVLSACDTGQGRITGDGVVGLSRSLLAAGVPSVIVSLWAVPDAPTEKLMVAFYKNLQRQPDKAQALRQAMLTTRQDHPHPVNWAAFTLIGAARAPAS